MKAADRFHPETIAKMRADLADALATRGVVPERGVEVLWVAQVDQEGRLAEISPVARGGPDMVPALFPHMSRGAAVVHNHPGGDLRPSSADLNIASRLGNQGIGFLIVDDQVEEVNVVAEPVPRRDIVLLDKDELAAVLESGGELSDRLDSFESRPGQIAMLRSVTDAFSNGGIFIAEAGTGIGKSFAYLLPALRWAADNQERIVISTATIALQQQLIDKDLPLAQALLGTDVNPVLVKGRGNYLCLKRLHEIGNEDDLFHSRDGIAGLREWAATTATGARSDIPFRPVEEDWMRVRCESDACPGSFCRYFDKCFLMRTRRLAADSLLLVANHHLLFADLAARSNGVGPDEAAVLPPYRRIVLDEAHHIESSATGLFTATLSLTLLNRLFHRLYRKSTRQDSGLLQKLADRNSALSEVFMGKLPKLIDTCQARAETLDALGRDLLSNGSPTRLYGEETELERTRFLAPMEGLRAGISELLGHFADGVSETGNDGSDLELEALLVEARQVCRGLQEAVSLSEAFLHRDEFPHEVFWLESLRRSGGSEWLFCHRTPLSVAKVLTEALWEPYETVIAVSATLAVGGRFQHWKHRVGADHAPGEVGEQIFSSPFDFTKQVFVGIPTDAPPPEDSQGWEGFMINAISDALDLTGGHALVLFTSYETLRRTLRGVRTRLAESSPLILAQGDDDRGRLLKKFREHPSSVLFAADSFWEGVDVPGESLRLVVITRLPFRPPNNPVAQARRDAVAASGGNPFFEFTLPGALTRFRQGFGRLMRRSDDQGGVVVLDSRIISKSYGHLFLDALPETSRSIKAWTGVCRDLEDFLF